MQISFTLFDGCYASSVMGPHDAFQIANDHALGGALLEEPPCSCRFLSVDGGMISMSGGRVFADTAGIDSVAAPDLIFLPSFPYRGRKEFDALLARNRSLLGWLRSSWEAGSVVVASCTGTFLLAETGLLNQRVATTTWWLERQFRVRYPAVRLDRQAVVSYQDRLMCAGAMNSAMNLAIDIIARFVSSELATRCARTMMIDTSRQVQPFLQGAMLDAGSDHPIVLRAQHWLHAHFSEEINLTELAARLNVSTRSLIRHFNDELGMTPVQYLQALRVEMAKTLLEQSRLPMGEVVRQVGYVDIVSFSRLFRRTVGMNPSEYRKRVAADQAYSKSA